MSSYYIWLPTVSIDSPNTLVCFLTPGDLGYEIAKGTKDFIGQILEDLKIQNEPENWKITPCRTKFFSDYLGEEDWRDNWQLVWKIAIQMKNSLIISIPHLEVTPTMAIDESWSSRNQINHERPVNCLIISNFLNQKSRNDAIRTIETDTTCTQMQKKLNINRPNFAKYDFGKNISQLHIDIGKLPGSFYSTGATYAEHIISIVQNSNGTIHYESLSL